MTGRADWVLRKRSVTLSGHRTSVSLEGAFWHELERLAALRETSLASLVAKVDAERLPQQNLSSALRLHVLASLKNTP